jgi:hypothetical protein
LLISIILQALPGEKSKIEEVCHELLLSMPHGVKYGSSFEARQWESGMKKEHKTARRAI